MREATNLEAAAGLLLIYLRVAGGKCRPPLGNFRFHGENVHIASLRISHITGLNGVAARRKGDILKFTRTKTHIQISPSYCILHVLLNPIRLP